MSRTTVWPAQRALDHQLLDLLLRDAVVALRLADRDQLDLAAGVFEHAGAGEPVVEDDVGCLQRAHGLERQQLRIAWTGADEEHAALRRLCLHRGFDRFAHQAAGFFVFTGKGRFARRAVEHAFPELAARASCRKLLGDRLAELSGKSRKRIEPGMKLALEPGAQALGEHGRGTLGADGDRHLAAIDDRRHDEAAQRRLVGHVDGHAERPRHRCDARILIVVAGGGNDQGTAADLIDPGTRGISVTRPARSSSASSGTSSPAATSTISARFNSSRALTAASSPPPVTRGGLRSTLMKIGKVRICP